jgi:hypothetical protein
MVCECLTLLLSFNFLKKATWRKNFSSCSFSRSFIIPFSYFRSCIFVSLLGLRFRVTLRVDLDFFSFFYFHPLTFFPSFPSFLCYDLKQWVSIFYSFSFLFSPFFSIFCSFFSSRLRFGSKWQSHLMGLNFPYFIFVPFPIYFIF